MIHELLAKSFSPFLKITYFLRKTNLIFCKLYKLIYVCEMMSGSSKQNIVANAIYGDNNTIINSSFNVVGQQNITTSRNREWGNEMSGSNINEFVSNRFCNLQSRHLEISVFNLPTLAIDLKIDENDPKVKKRRNLLENKLSYLNEFKLSVSRDSVMDKFEDTEEIGKGSFGKVHKIKHNGQVMALKLIELSSNKEQDVKNLREAILNKKLTHENVVNFLDCWIEFDERENVWVNLLMELCQTNLAKWYEEDMDRNYKKCTDMFKQISCGLKYIHSQKIIHRDLKPENILIDFSGTCKIADFGLSTLHSTKYGLNHTSNLGTYTFAAPEQLKGKDYDFKVDIFSLGLTLVGIFVKFTDENELKSVLISIKEDRDLPDIYMVKFNLEGKLILEMTENDPIIRPNIDIVIEKNELILKNSMSL